MAPGPISSDRLRFSCSRNHDTQLRPSILTAKNGGVTLTSSAYATGNRLSTVDRSFSATYSYLAKSPLLEKIGFRQSSAVRMISTRNHDNLNFLSTSQKLC
jgi:hypothetical protein